MLFAVAEYDPVTGSAPLYLPERVRPLQLEGPSMVWVPQAGYTEDTHSSSIVGAPVQHAQDVELQHVMSWQSMGDYILSVVLRFTLCFE